MPICTAALGHFLRPRVHIDGDSLYVQACTFPSACLLVVLPMPLPPECRRISAITLKKKKKIVRIKKEIQNGPVANSYMTNVLLIYGEIFVRFLVY